MKAKAIFEMNLLAGVVFSDPLFGLGLDYCRLRKAMISNYAGVAETATNALISSMLMLNNVCA